MELLPHPATSTFQGSLLSSVALSHLEHQPGLKLPTASFSGSNSQKRSDRSNSQKEGRLLIHSRMPWVVSEEEPHQRRPPHPPLVRTFRVTPWVPDVSGSHLAPPQAARRDPPCSGARLPSALRPGGLDDSSDRCEFLGHWPGPGGPGEAIGATNKGTA